MTEKAVKDDAEATVVPTTERAPDDLAEQIARLRQHGSNAAHLAADVYQDVLDGKVEWADAEAEMTAREAR